MIIYSVKCIVQKESAQDWEDYFISEHLDDVKNTGCFTGYSFRRGGETADGVVYLSEYHCPSQEMLAKYNADYAAALKKDAMDKFGGKFKAEREIYEVLAVKGS